MGVYSPPMTTPQKTPPQKTPVTAGNERIDLVPGMRVRVTQQVVLQSKPQTSTVEGVVQSFGQQKTGSWFAHSEDNKLWIDRLRLKLDDGEIVCCNLDSLSRVEVVGE